MKVLRHRVYGELIPLPPLERPWQSISIDFIISLPPLRYRNNVYDSILVVVDRYSKIVRLVSYNKTITS